MITNVYAVRDEVACLYKYDFRRQRHGEAIRFFSDGVQMKDTEIGRHPADFSLYHLGTFNDETGRFESLDVPHRLCGGLDFIDGYVSGSVTTA